MRTNDSIDETSAGSLPSEAGRKPLFATTHWTVVLSAGQNDTSAQSALAKLCQTYWYPLYGYIRGYGKSREDAQDLTQAFFAQLLEKNWVGAADPEKGRFRSFLLVVLKRFLAGEWDKARAQKRGGGQQPLSLQFDTAETRLSHEPAYTVTPEQSFERRWALTLLDQVWSRLKSEYEQEGKGNLFTELHPCLVGDRTSLPYAELAKKLGATESGIKTAVHRFRQRYRTILREEIAQTVNCPAEVDEELRYLAAVLARKG